MLYSADTLSTEISGSNKHACHFAWKEQKMILKYGNEQGGENKKKKKKSDI